MLKIAAYLPSKARHVGVLFLRLKKKQDKTKKLVEKHHFLYKLLFHSSK
ncbi:hypothetical protein LL3_00236 [Bacillus amyloliquefaciens LL3]|nr:hypothetical protein LL3_00236 [Bacillus amyloliquefaciens LL3]